MWWVSVPRRSSCSTTAIAVGSLLCPTSNPTVTDPMPPPFLQKPCRYLLVEMLASLRLENDTCTPVRTKTHQECDAPRPRTLALCAAPPWLALRSAPTARELR